ncbi:transcription termination factor Rho [Mycobacterium sp.]|uniref:transcription termination factor Rho n=1 Tax=Mycobacterium sp. TaxID=1785 RepID=UPI002CD65D7B|nr:transcription termination factor Rho [Mycobacterium sp.]HME48901.1 transcription termination factor Rho [Mycobacterium sp.]
MTDTDLITAGSGAGDTELPTTVTSDVNASEPARIASNAPAANADGGLGSMVLPELRALANEVGVKGASGMRKNELIAAIRERRGEPNANAHNGEAAAADRAEGAAGAATGTEPQRRERRAPSREAGAREKDASDKPKADDTAPAKSDEDTKQDGTAEQAQGGQQNRDDDVEGRQGRRGRRFRDRRRRGERGGGDGNGEAELREDDVVQPVAGILDVLDNYAFVRTSGYLAGPNDVYVSMNMVRKNGLRRGDAITGAVRVPKDGEQPNQRQKFNPLVRLDSVNGGPVEDARKRPEFGKLTPLYPNQRLRLETSTDRLTTRIIDLIMPIGKGQRALIVSPPKAGKTTILKDIANAVTRNNPECHLMVVLVDERPEEVTDMQRSVKGEVIASTFDRPPSDHTSVAELAIERAKRLVEQGRDVVVLLDSITRLGRAYNNASPASGRILSGGVDSTALYPPKRFLGAARNIEEGGSLTVIATAMVETGSTGDTVIFEEFKGTGNAELKLDRKIAERRVFPAVDVNPSGTRKDELLLSPDEFAVVHKLRRVLSGLDSHQAIDLLMSQLRKTKTNYEFLVQVSKTAPGAVDEDYA